MPDYDELHNKAEDLKLAEQRLTDALEAVSEIRGDGIEAFRVDIQDKIYELRENRRQVEAAMYVIQKAEERAMGYGRPVEE